MFYYYYTVSWTGQQFWGAQMPTYQLYEVQILDTVSSMPHENTIFTYIRI